MTTDTTTDVVVLDEENTDTPDTTEDSSNSVALGAICIAAGVAVGTFVVPPVVGWVKGWFTSDSAPAADAVVEAIEAAPAEKTETV